HMGFVVGMWDLPQPGIKLGSPALAGRFLTHCATKDVQLIFFFFDSVITYIIKLKGERRMIIVEEFHSRQGYITDF
ncbi:hypothetical protein, partial [Brucella melitensis]|uniref:hypothetical protein n=1 Tax=Brucella melitensis TaxID=29459 RepID=UPI003B67F286